MRMIVVGCGRLGAELAFGLFRSGYEVCVIDQDAHAFANLPPDFRGRTMEGDMLTREMMTRAGVEAASGLAAVTSSDAVNCLIGHVARSTYAVPNVVIRNYNPRWLGLVQAFGLQVVSSSSWGAQRMEELLQGSVHTVFSAGNGEVEVYEFRVPPAWAGRPAGELLADAEASPVSLTRAGAASLLDGGARLAADDVLHLAATRAGAEALRSRLAEGKEA